MQATATRSRTGLRQPGDTEHMEILPATIQCPYCGEHFETQVDLSAGNQEYIEDCYICCCPIVFDICIDIEGDTSVSVRREDE